MTSDRPVDPWPSLDSAWSFLRRIRREERANTLVLFPAALLIVLGLGALAVDSAVLFLGQRRLADLAASVANDAVAGLSAEAFYDPSGSSIELDQARAGRRAQQLVAAQSEDRSIEAVACHVKVDGLRADVECEAVVRPLLAPMWPGLAPTQRITARDAAIGVIGSG